MKIAVISNNNGVGLQVEARLLSEFLLSLGQQVEILQYDIPYTGTTRFDIGIYLEVVNEALFGLAKRNLYFANPEWLKSSYIPVVKAHCDTVFAKTRHAEKVLKETFPTVEYVGFLATDKMDYSINREQKFLHIGGNSGFRNTGAVISAWREYRYWNGIDAPSAPLTVVSNSKMVSCEDTPDVTFIQRATDEEIKQLQNSHLFHLFPSAYEGFGHALHEAMSVGAVILTTDAEPMNEIHAPYLVRAFRERKNNLGTLHDVSGKTIREKVPVMLEENHEPCLSMRYQFVADNDRFKQEFPKFLDAPVLVRHRSRDSKARIAMIGNFEPQYSTENDLLWTLKDMGHEVHAYQENKVPLETVLGDSRILGVDLLLYVHTHGWNSQGQMSLLDLWDGLKAQGTKTCSFHLDRYWGLNQLDRREDLIGMHPFWKTDCVFTADGGNHDWKSRGVNHVWLPPGVSKRNCVSGEWSDSLSVRVGFVGSQNYHPEYQFRAELLDFLGRQYAENFRIFNGIRGKGLSDLYASIDVVVGDSCFAGEDRYWSDRVPETLGRAGFLIHPEVRGLRVPGLVTFEPQNLQDLKYRIDYYLKWKDERDYLRRTAHVWSRENETYHCRMETLLRTMGCQ